VFVSLCVTAVRCWGEARGVPKGELTMPRDKDLKRLVRARMKKTGEAYTAARAQLLKKAPLQKARVTKAPARTAAKSTAADYATLAGMSDAVIQEKTGRTWDGWVQALDSHGAAELPHRDIAMLVSTTYKVGAWWTQSVAVGYERIKGLRARGQRRDGTYEASKSRTFDVPVSTLFDAWADARRRKRWLGETGVKVRTATAPKSMRLQMPEGAIVAVGFYAKGTDKSSVQLEQARLPDRETAEALKQRWSERLDALREELER
jgi:hypothetical protein